MNDFDAEMAIFEERFGFGKNKDAVSIEYAGEDVPYEVGSIDMVDDSNTLYTIRLKQKTNDGSEFTDIFKYSLDDFSLNRLSDDGRLLPANFSSGADHARIYKKVRKYRAK